MKPGFLRFPGGCIVEGRYLETRYQWKTTIGDAVRAQAASSTAGTTSSRNRPTPDYYQSFGLGFFEYFQLAEDIGAEPLPILNCGMACQFNSSELVPRRTSSIRYMQDALDLIEFANGPVTSAVGRSGAAMGHPAPFNLKMHRRRQRAVGAAVRRALRDVPARCSRRSIRRSTLVAERRSVRRAARTSTSLWAQAARARRRTSSTSTTTCRPTWFLSNAGRYDKLPAHRARRSSPASTPRTSRCAIARHDGRAR